MKSVVKKIKSVRNNIKSIEELLLNINSEFQLPQDEFNKLMIAVSELVMNAIVHGNRLDEKKFVEVCIDYDDDTMNVKIRDEGGGFNTNELPDPTLDENLIKPLGRGLFIAKSLFENIELKKKEKGMEFILTVKKNK